LAASPAHMRISDWLNPTSPPRACRAISASLAPQLARSALDARHATKTQTRRMTTPQL
jgi:hypothetical protein